MSFFAVFAVSSLDVWFVWFKYPWPSYFNRCRC